MEYGVVFSYSNKIYVPALSPLSFADLPVIAWNPTIIVG